MRESLVTVECKRSRGHFHTVTRREAEQLLCLEEEKREDFLHAANSFPSGGSQRQRPYRRPSQMMIH